MKTAEELFNEKHGTCHWSTVAQLNEALNQNASIVREEGYDTEHRQFQVVWPDGSSRNLTIPYPFIEEEKSLYIAGYDRNGVFRFSIPAGSTIPAGVVAGKGWTLRTEYKVNLKCGACGDYLFTKDSECSCPN